MITLLPRLDFLLERDALTADAPRAYKAHAAFAKTAKIGSALARLDVSNAVAVRAGKCVPLNNAVRINESCVSLRL